MLKPGDRVHIATKDHHTYNNAEVTSDDGVTLELKGDVGFTGPHIEPMSVKWTDVWYCVEQAQWDLELSLVQEKEEDDDNG